MKSDPADDQLLQSAISAQVKIIRFEGTVCGPKTLEYMLNEGLIMAPAMSPTAPHLFPPRERSVSSGEPGERDSREPQKSVLDYKHLAKLCNTDDKGTSIEGMRAALKTLGIESYGLELNRQDFNHLTLPAILLEGDHYFALLERHGTKLIVYDTLLKGKRQIELPALDDAEFRATVIAFSMPDLDADPETPLQGMPKLETQSPAPKTSPKKPSNAKTLQRSPSGNTQYPTPNTSGLPSNASTLQHSNASSPTGVRS